MNECQSSEPLKACPSCGHDKFTVTGSPHQIKCVKCGMEGPDAYNAVDAANLWNALPRRLPKEPPSGMVRASFFMYVNKYGGFDLVDLGGTDGGPWQQRRVVVDLPAFQEPEIPTVEGVCNE